MTKDSGSDSTTVKWKCRNIFAVTNFPPILGAHNPFLSTKRRCEIAVHMSRVADEYVEMGQNEKQLLKAGSLRKGTRRQITPFLLSIMKDYATMVKDEDDQYEDSAE